MSKKQKIITLDPKTDFTPKQLREHLEKNFKEKSKGEKFTNQDIYGYSMRGAVPKAYGGYLIEVLDFKGVRIYRITK